jgi:hypothetical protein
MSALSPTEYELIVESQDEFGRPEEIRGQCQFRESLPYVTSVCLMNFGALLLTVGQAFKARNLSTEFAESAQIFRALTAITLVLFVGGPVLLLARDNADTFVFVASAIIFVTCCSILLLLFIPKIHFLKESRKRAPSRARLHISGISGIDMSLSSGLPTDSYSECDGDTEEYTGMKILTTKAPEQLLKEIEALKRLLKRARDSKDEKLGEEIVDSTIHQVEHRSLPVKTSILKNSSENSLVSRSNRSTVSKIRSLSNDSSKGLPAESLRQGQPSGNMEEVERKEYVVPLRG